MSLLKPIFVSTFLILLLTSSWSLSHAKKLDIDGHKVTFGKGHGKVIRIVKDKFWIRYEYDKKGKFLKAKKSDKENLEVLYDSKGRLFKLLFYTGKKKVDVLTFRYNSKQAKIHKILLGTKGGVEVGPKGEVLKVEGGEIVPRRISVLIQQFIDLARPKKPNILRSHAPAANMATYLEYMTQNI